MNARNFALSVIAVTMILSMSSCLKDDSAAQKAKEMNILKEYIAANYPTATPTSSGLYYIETLAGTGDSAKVNTWMEVSFTGRLVSNNDVVMTSDKQVANDNGIYQAGTFYGPARLLLGYISYRGLNEGISMMKEGGKARLVFPSDLGLGGSSNSYIPAYSSLIFDVELVKVIPDIKSYENARLLQYLVNNEIPTDSTANGIYFVETAAGDSIHPKLGSSVTLTYTGRFLDGTIFDSGGKGFTFNVGYGNIIPGFEAAVNLMSKGSSATVVIPYYYAYGEYGRVDSNYRIIIPPFTTLVFDITVTNIAK